MPISFSLHVLNATRDAGRTGAAPGPIRLPLAPISGAAGAWVAPASDGDGVRLHLFTGPHAGERAPEDAVFLEPVRLEGKPALVAGTLGAGVRINGVAAPAVAVLREGDVVSLASSDGLASARVETEVRPYIGPPRACDADRVCHLCLSPVTAVDAEGSDASATAGAGSEAGTEPDVTRAAWIYECGFCEKVVLHVHAVVGGELLECARLTSSCPHCGAQVDLADDDAIQEGDHATHD